MAQIITLFKSLSPAQVAAVAESGWRQIFPQEPEQTHFYPKVYVEYAEQIARRWDVPQYGGGYVVRFTMRGDFMRRYATQTVAFEEYREYIIPIAELDFFNRNIQGRIDVVSAFSGVHEKCGRQRVATATGHQ